MKKLIVILASVFGLMSVSTAHSYGRTSINSYADAFVFDEMGITFSVYPDGEFDFYLPQNQQTTTVSNGYVNVTFNSGYNYNPYVQYDDFGAVIQVENVPVWYDYYGRVSQIGDVMISYRNRRIYQVGGLYVYYNQNGNYWYHTGYINRWNPYFVYRPFYVAFARPSMGFVHITAYRQYYTPVRYTYYRPYAHNSRPHYATVGHAYRPKGAHGVGNTSYNQSAGKGEVAYTRERKTVTTASVQQQALNPKNGSAVHATAPKKETGRTEVQTRGNEVHPSLQQPANNRITSKPVPAAVQRQNADMRVAPKATQRPTMQREVNTPHPAVKPSANTHQNIQPERSVNPALNGNRPPERMQPARGTASPQQHARPAVAQPAARPQSRVSGTVPKGNPGLKTSAPARRGN